MRQSKPIMIVSDLNSLAPLCVSMAFLVAWFGAALLVRRREIHKPSRLQVSGYLLFGPFWFLLGERLNRSLTER